MRDVGSNTTLYYRSEMTSTNTLPVFPFQLFRRPLLQPQFTDIFPTDFPPFLEYCLQLVQILGFLKVSLG